MNRTPKRIIDHLTRGSDAAIDLDVFTEPVPDDARPLTWTNCENFGLVDRDFWGPATRLETLPKDLWQAAAAEISRAVLLWRRRQGKIFRVADDHVVFFDGCGLRRMPDGRLIAWGISYRNNVPDPRGVKAHVRLTELYAWLSNEAHLQVHRIAILAARDLLGDFAASVIRDARFDRLVKHLTRRCAGGSLHRWIGPVMKAMWRLIDRDIVRLAQKCTGGRATFSTCNHILQHRQDLLRIERESPVWLPVAWSVFTYGPDRTGFSLETLDANVLRELKRGMAANGCSPAGWKALCALPPAHMRWMANFMNLYGIGEMGNYLAEVGAIPPYSLLQRWQLHLTGRIGMPPAWFARAAAREALRRKRQGRLRDFLFNEYEQARDWVMLGHYQPDANQQKAGWAWIKRRSDAWHAERPTAPARPARKLSWDGLLEPFRFGEYNIIPLTSSEALAEESRAMHHCVSGYDNYCFQHGHRIFAIRHITNSKLRATMEIVPSHNGWQGSQLRGPCNAAVCQDIRAAAKEVLRRANRTAGRSVRNVA